MIAKRLPPVHPGEVLLEEFLKPLARYFDMSPQFWLGLQSDYDLDVATDELGERLEREVQVRANAG